MKITHTYSIVAASDDLSEIGVAVQSHWFAVGAICPWIIPGIGAIVTQSMVEISYGPQGLSLLEDGGTPQHILPSLLHKDGEREFRQVAIINAQGKIATHTGKMCIAEAGHKVGHNYSVQANMMINNSIWSAMADAFETSQGKLAERLFASLEAAQKAGGDLRGEQSAAMMVADNIRDDQPWSHFTTNLRIDDNIHPLKELRRLLNLEGAYNMMNEGDSLIAKGNFSLSQKKYDAAEKLAPGNNEILFWNAVTLAKIGEMKKALRIFKDVFKKNPNWATLVGRLPESGLLPKDPNLMQEILSVAPKRKS